MGKGWQLALDTHPRPTGPSPSLSCSVTCSGTRQSTWARAGSSPTQTYRAFAHFILLCNLLRNTQKYMGKGCQLALDAAPRTTDPVPSQSCSDSA